MRIILALTALLLAGCAASAAPRTSPPPSAASPTPVATAGWSDAAACRAFREAATTGVPASAGVENTMTWLQQQDTGAYPRLQAAITRLARAWADPADTAAISRAQAAVTRICRT